jgi:hypothetical protein
VKNSAKQHREVASRWVWIDFVETGLDLPLFFLIPDQSQGDVSNIISTTTPHFSAVCLGPAPSTRGDMGYLASQIACRDARPPSVTNPIGVVRVTAV